MDKYNAQVYLFSKLIPVLQNIKKLFIHFFFKTVISMHDFECFYLFINKSGSIRLLVSVSICIEKTKKEDIS